MSLQNNNHKNKQTNHFTEKEGHKRQEEREEVNH